MRKWRHGGVESFAPGYIRSKCLSQWLNTRSLTAELSLLSQLLDIPREFGSLDQKENWIYSWSKNFALMNLSDRSVWLAVWMIMMAKKKKKRQLTITNICNNSPFPKHNTHISILCDLPKCPAPVFNTEIIWHLNKWTEWWIDNFFLHCHRLYYPHVTLMLISL